MSRFIVLQLLKTGDNEDLTVIPVVHPVAGRMHSIEDLETANFIANHLHHGFVYDVAFTQQAVMDLLNKLAQETNRADKLQQELDRIKKPLI